MYFKAASSKRLLLLPTTRFGNFYAWIFKILGIIFIFKKIFLRHQISLCYKALTVVAFTNIFFCFTGIKIELSTKTRKIFLGTIDITKTSFLSIYF